MSWHKMTLKVIDVLALLGLRCFGTHHLLANKGFDKPDFYGIISIDHLLMPTWNTGKIPIKDNWIPIKDN